MIHGLILDPRVWKIDFTTSPFWNPEKYGVSIDLHPNAFHIPKVGIDKKYKFVIATEVWELPMQKTLEYLRDKGLKVILVPREVAHTASYAAIMFNYEKFRNNGNKECYFKPDIVLGSGEKSIEVWDNRVPTKSIGYPRLDICLRKDKWKSKDKILERHGIEKGKKIIFFPAYPPSYLQTIDGKSITVDLYEDLQNTLRALEQYALSRDDVQVISKIHPMSFKCYRKGIGSKKEVAGLLKKYYEKPAKHMKVIGDIRTDSSVSREMVQIADIVVGYNSMMILEAILIGKPILHLKLRQATDLNEALNFDQDLITLYEQDLHKLPEYLDNVDKLDSGNMELVERYLGKVDGNFCKRLCDEIKAIV